MIEDFDKLVIYTRMVPKREGVYVGYPKALHPELKSFLKKSGIHQLYSHQAEMFERVCAHENVVITTSTASGKTLSFLLPVLNEILYHPSARAIFIYPTKALAADQYRALKPYLDYFGENRICAGVYDGDTPVDERSRIRKKANIILTNPEMLNGAFLPNHSRYGFDFIFSNLKYVVIDELHSYRGVFGSHVANVFRRMGRICRYYRAEPQFLCSSATIANPVELAQNICGKPFVKIDRDGSPAAARNYFLLQPPRVENENHEFISQKQATMIAADMIPDLVENHHSFIAFAKSRRNVEVVLREARDKLDGMSLMGHSLSHKISGYRGGYTPLQRKEIEKKMISGELSGLVSTNALELGIDIGKIDTTILVGYPGTRASFWQQTGRAGRKGDLCNNYLILESLPKDQYIAVRPGWLFDTEQENAIVDQNNLLIELAHIRSAAAELPLSLDDIAVFPDLAEAIPVLLRVEELRSQGGKFSWCGSAFPAGDYSLRNIDKNRYKVMDKTKHVMITEMDELQAFREVHDGAIYMHDGVQYQVVKLDLETRTAFVVPFEGNYYTMPGGETEVRVIRERKTDSFYRTGIALGDVNINDIVFMYKKLQFHNHQNLGYEMLPKPLSKDYDTESTWIRIPENVISVYRRLLQPDREGKLVRNNHFDGMCHAVKTAAMMVTMSEDSDLGAQMSSNAIGMSCPDQDAVYLFLYDKFVGGLGYAEKAYDKMEDIVDQAIALISECPCKNGCAACVGDYKLDKKAVLWGLRSLKEELEAPKDYKYVEYPERKAEKKAFAFKELPARWDEFCSYLKKNGESYADFLSTIEDVVIDGDTIILETSQSFYKDWMEDPINKRGLINLFEFHTECPKNIRLQVRAGQDELSSERENYLKDELRKRYDKLTK